MNAAPTKSLTVLFARLFWMLIGPLALVLTSYFIVTSGTGWQTPADLLYFLALGGMILGRWTEFRSGTATNSLGEPVTRTEVHRYILLVAIAGPIVWVVANVIGNHLVRN